MLPFESRPWAKRLALCVIVFSLALTIATGFYMSRDRPLDLPEFLIGALFLLAVIPPNVAIVLRKPGQPPRTLAATRPLHTRVTDSRR